MSEDRGCRSFVSIRLSLSSKTKNFHLVCAKRDTDTTDLHAIDRVVDLQAVYLRMVALQAVDLRGFDPQGVGLGTAAARDDR